MALISIDPQRRLGTVDRNLFGNFIEHLGRCIYGGIYDPRLAQADADGLRRDVLAAAKELQVSVLRWPGGNFTSGYHWKDGIGPREGRPARPELAWHAVEPNTIGTDEFISFCRKVGAEPYIAVNCGSGDMQEAQDWVEYCNGSQPTYWAEQRRKNGHPEPYGVKYWGIGNEVDGHWQIGHKDADEYGKTAREFAKVMKWLDPSIKIIASGSSDWGKDWGVNWDYTITRYLHEQIDDVGTHIYCGDAGNDFLQFMSTGELMDQRIEATAAAIAAARASQRCTRPIYIAMDEWGVWYRAFAGEQMQERYNLADALATALYLNSFLRHADVVKMANWAQLVNVIAPLMTIGEHLLVQSTFYPLALYAAHNGGDALDLHVEGDGYEQIIPGSQWMPAQAYTPRYVNASATLRERNLTLNLVNRHPDDAQQVDLLLQGASLHGQLSGWRVEGDGAHAYNTLENPQAVRQTPIPAQDVRERLTLTLPPMSVSVYRTELA